MSADAEVTALHARLAKAWQVKQEMAQARLTRRSRRVGTAGGRNIQNYLAQDNSG